MANACYLPCHRGRERIPAGPATLRYAAALARSHSATLIPVLAWLPPGSEVAYCTCPSGHLRPVWEQDARERLEAALTTALGGVPADMTTEPLVVCGAAGRVLAQTASRPGDLLVIGTGRQGSLSRLVGGGVSRYWPSRHHPWNYKPGTAGCSGTAG